MPDLRQMRAHGFTGGDWIVPHNGVEYLFVMELPARQAALRQRNALALFAQ